ncbi:MAG: condensation domain-containing protein, partial [Psychrosphaera sp.]|nr:condensation domain-containing protein [Psychrosphaera sp.]
MIDNPSAAALAIKLEPAALTKQEHKLEQKLPIADHRNPLPLTLAQQRIWFIQQLDPQNTSYNLPAYFDVKGPINLNALSQACAELVERHHMLR